MSTGRGTRVSAATGVGFVVLSLAAGFIYPQQPRVDAPAATTAAWVNAHRVALQTGMIFGLVAAALLVWFVGTLRSSFTSTRDDTLAPVVFGAGIAVAVISALAAMPIALLAFMAAQREGLNDLSIVRMLGDVNIVLFGAASAMTAAFLVALGITIRHGHLPLPGWLGWLSFVVAAANALAIWIGETFSTYHGKVSNAAGFGAFIGFLLVVLLASVALMRPDPALQS
jgi:hypothetical protein